MENHYNLTDTEFINQFINCELDPSDFTHEAHLRLAWVNIKLHGIKKAKNEIQNQLRNFVACVDAHGKYNTTVTIAAMKTVYHFMLSSKSDEFKDFIIDAPQLKRNFKGLLAAHYSFDIFNSDHAKKEFIEPDLTPFD